MHLRCGVCGGPENWCLDRFGEVWVRCLDESCLAHLQMEFWPEEPIWPERVDPVVRAVPLDVQPELNSSENSPEKSGDLPF